MYDRFSPAPEGFRRTAGGILVPCVEAKNPLADQLLGRGRYTGQIIRDGVVIDEFDVKNLVVNQGLNYLLSSALAGGAQITSWYIALFSGNYTVLATDVASGIASNATEIASTDFTGAARQAWTANSSTVTGESTSNSSSQASFTFSASKTIYGGFLISSATCQGTSGTLFSGAQFGAAKSVVSGDILLLTYTYTAASA